MVSRGRVDLADGAVHVAAVPGRALGIERDGVRLGVRRQLEFLHLAGDRIEPANQIAELTHPPDRTVRRLDGIARPLTERRHCPFLDRDLNRTGYLFRRAARIRRIVLRQIVDDRRLRRRITGQVDHRTGELFPVLGGVAGAAGDHVGLVTPGAYPGDQILALAVRQSLRLGCERDQNDRRRERQLHL